MEKKNNPDSVIIKKLTQIVEANLSDEHFGVAELAQKAGMSHSQIHRKLHTLTKQSSSQFIREIRLNKAKDLLQQEKYTVAEVAYKVGFGSPSYFNKCFHDYFNYPPGEFKNHTHENKVGERRNTNSDVGVYSANNQSKTGKKYLFRNKFIQAAFLILLIVALSFFTYSYFNGNSAHTTRTKSIAVLPLRNLSNEIENQHLADGIMEDILNRLSQIQEFKVVSRISAETSYSSETTIQDIAKELGVSYVLEGSLLRHGEKVRLYVQLIDAKINDTVWSDIYDDNLSDIFAFISDVSQQIADELQVVLSPKEKEQIEKVYTTNAEAYQLYQKGRFFWERRTEEDSNRSIEYFIEALDLDSTYALAYAGLADAYFISAWWKWCPQAQGYAKSKAYANKALELDNSLAEAHATLGAIACWYDYNWEFAEKELKKAIEINPSNADANQYYSEYFDIFGKDSLARFYINKSIELSPNSKVRYYESSLYYYNEGKMDEALKEGEKVLELDKNFRKQNLNNFMIYIHKKEDKKAINSLSKFLVLSYPDEVNTVHLNRIYNEMGIPGIIRFTIEEMLKSSKADYFIIAKLCALLYDKESTLVYLNKALVCSSQIPRIKNCLDFMFISDEPEFQMLLEELNLPLN